MTINKLELAKKWKKEIILIAIIISVAIYGFVCPSYISSKNTINVMIGFGIFIGYSWLMFYTVKWLIKLK